MEGGEGEERLLETVKILPASATRENTVCNSILDHTLDRHTHSFYYFNKLITAPPMVQI